MLGHGHICLSEADAITEKAEIPYTAYCLFSVQDSVKSSRLRSRSSYCQTMGTFPVVMKTLTTVPVWLRDDTEIMANN